MSASIRTDAKSVFSFCSRFFSKQGGVWCRCWETPLSGRRPALSWLQMSPPTPCPVSTPSTPYAMQTESKVCAPACTHGQNRISHIVLMNDQTNGVLSAEHYMYLTARRWFGNWSNACFVCIPRRKQMSNEWLNECTVKLDNVFDVDCGGVTPGCQGLSINKMLFTLCIYKCKMTVCDLTCLHSHPALDPACSVKSALRLHAVQLSVTCLCGCNLHIRQDYIKEDWPQHTIDMQS